MKDKVAIVTGGGRNIGEAVSLVLAEAGAHVAVVDMSAERGEAVAAKVREMAGSAEAFVGDVSDEDSVRALVGNVVERFGGIDILVNNAAISDNRSILEITREEWDKTIAVTLTGTFLMCRHVAEQMVEQGRGGTIINVESTSAFLGRQRAIAYASAKGGVVNMTRALAVQLAPHDIRVCGVVPNKIGSPVGKDEFDPNRPVKNLRNRTGVPMDMARAIRFLASEDADFITGDHLFVDGGVAAMMVAD